MNVAKKRTWMQDLFKSDTQIPHQSDTGVRTGVGHLPDFPWPQSQQPAQQQTGTGGTAGRTAWYDIGEGFQKQPFGVQAPSVSAPSVAPPKIPDPATAIPGLYGEHIKTDHVSEIEDLIGEITGRTIAPPPEIRVDDEFLQGLFQQYGIQPKSAEEVQEHARAIVERQKFSQEQILMREIDRFERDYPTEFRQVEAMLKESVEGYSAEKAEEMSARGMFYSSVMSNAVGVADRELVRQLGDISRDAANRVSDLRADVRDLAQWAILEEEVIKRELEMVEDQKRMQMMQIHLEVATWADQMAIDSWYRHETLQHQNDQLQLQAIQLKMQEAERMGQHLASAFMADHPLVQNTMLSMGMTPEAFGQLPVEQQAAMVNGIVHYNDVEQQMRQREFQMRAVVAEIQLQNANMQLQASIANAQFSMEAQKLSLQHLMHQDQMSLAWSQHGLDATMANWQMSQPRGGVGTAAAQEPGLNFDAYNMGVDMYQQGVPNSMINTYLQTLDPETAAAIRRDGPSWRQKEETTTKKSTTQKTSMSDWLGNLLGGTTSSGGLEKAVRGRTGIR